MANRNKDLQAEVAGELKKFRIPNQARTRISRQFMMAAKKDNK
jgi:hypothetical protein